MSFGEMVQTFLLNIKETRWQEWISTLTQIASVWYAKKNNVLVYPTGIIGVLLAAYVYYFLAKPPLYADAILNLYYFIMSVYGWYNWVQIKETGSLVYPISWCHKKELWLGIGFFLLSWVAIYSAITAMWWMAKRKVENWLAWIFSNIVAIPLNFYKGFILFTLMYVLFLILAWMGYTEWKKAAKKYAAH